MKFTLGWLKEHLDTQADAMQVADALTRIGLEVEDVSNPADVMRPFKIAKVLTAAQHPQADKLGSDPWRGRGARDRARRRAPRRHCRND